MQLSMSEQLQSELSHEEQCLSSLSPERLRAWRLYFESALALLDVLDAEMERDAGIPIRWYDLLVHLEDEPGGLRMNELAERICTARAASRASSTAWKRRASYAANDPERPAVVPCRPHRRGPWDAGGQPAGTIAMRSRSTFSRHLSDADVKALTGHSRRSAHTRDPCALGAFAAKGTSDTRAGSCSVPDRLSRVAR